MGLFDWRSRAVSSPTTVDGALAVATIPIKDGVYEAINSGLAAGASLNGSMRDLGASNYQLNDFCRPHSCLVAFTNVSSATMVASLRMRIQWSRDGTNWQDACLPGATSPVLASTTTAAGATVAYCRALLLGRYYRWVFTNGGTAAIPAMHTWIYVQPTELA